MSLVNIIIIGIAVMLLMALAVVLFVVMYQRRIIHHQLEVKTLNEQKQLELLQASIQSEEDERTRIAGELHDDVGATLSSVGLFLHKAAENSPDSLIIQQSRELIDESIRKIRDISHKLQPAALQSLGLYASLQALCDMLNRSGSISLNFHHDQDLPRMSFHTELHIYRIIQELINNIIRHSKASTVTLSCSFFQQELKISLLHDGYGISKKDYPDLLQKKGSLGLKNIDNRLKFVNGSIEFDKESDSNFRSSLFIPINI
ncbi:MAG: histidine kinase [Bacteroidota bacterium]|nr:histidine kinase [Bacteroidota bacterium]